MPGMFSYSKTAVERAMKVQEVMMRAWAKKNTWWQASEILGITDRHLRRIREGYEKFGYFSLLDKRRGQAYFPEEFGKVAPSAETPRTRPHPDRP